MKFKIVLLFVLVAILVPGLSEAKKSSPNQAMTFTRSKMLPGGIPTEFNLVTLTKYKKEVDKVFQYVFSETSRIATLFNSDNPGSELAKVVTAAGTTPVKVSKETFVIVQHAKEIAEWTRGAFDPVVGPPGSFKYLKIDTENETLFLKKPGLSFNLRGILEGFIADLFIRAAYHANIDDAFAKVGGVTRAMGENPFGVWRVTVEGQGESRAKQGLTITLSNYSAATVGGRYYSPAMDPRTGEPVNSAFYSVTVLTKKAATAQGVASSIYAMKPRAGENLIRALGARAIFSMNDGTIKKVGKW